MPISCGHPFASSADRSILTFSGNSRHELESTMSQPVSVQMRRSAAMHSGRKYSRTDVGDAPCRTPSTSRKSRPRGAGDG